MARRRTGWAGLHPVLHRARRAYSGRDVGVGEAPVAEAGGVLALEPERLVVVALEQGDEQGQREERVGPELEQLRVVVGRERLALGVGQRQPGAPLALVTAEDHVGALGLPPLHGAARVGAVAL